MNEQTLLEDLNTLAATIKGDAAAKQAAAARRARLSYPLPDGSDVIEIHDRCDRREAQPFALPATAQDQVLVDARARLTGIRANLAAARAQAAAATQRLAGMTKTWDEAEGDALLDPPRIDPQALARVREQHATATEQARKADAMARALERDLARVTETVQTLEAEAGARRAAAYRAAYAEALRRLFPVLKVAHEIAEHAEAVFHAAATDFPGGPHATQPYLAGLPGNCTRPLNLTLHVHADAGGQIGRFFQEAVAFVRRQEAEAANPR